MKYTELADRSKLHGVAEMKLMSAARALLRYETDHCYMQKS